jgi:hypothetical protein
VRKPVQQPPHQARRMDTTKVRIADLETNMMINTATMTTATRIMQIVVTVEGVSTTLKMTTTRMATRTTTIDTVPRTTQTATAMTMTMVMKW